MNEEDAKYFGAWLNLFAVCFLFWAAYTAAISLSMISDSLKVLSEAKKGELWEESKSCLRQL
jgi:hypothetical protein